jgi:ABC-type Zn uptake system ZnuABC Zn-binding protein ZnuA
MVASAAALLLTLAGGCRQAADPWADAAGGAPRVVASFAPLYCFAVNVAGDDAAVKCLLSNRGPHDYPYDPKDVLPLRKADLFFINGLNLDDFAVKLRNNCGNRDLRLVELGESSALRPLLRKVEVQHEGHSHGSYDPHIWLGIPEAKLMVEEIARELAAQDEANADAYRRRAADYQGKLDRLHEYGKGLLKDKKNKAIVTFHEAFDYFAQSFGVEIAGFIEPRAGTDPSAKQIAQLVGLCNAKDVRAVAIEPQFAAKNAAETLVDAANKSRRAEGKPKMEIFTLDPLETALPEDLTPDWYETKMRQNIDNLAKVLP